VQVKSFAEHPKVIGHQEVVKQNVKDLAAHLTSARTSFKTKIKKKIIKKKHKFV
jgi:hypothetical protein